MMLTEIFHKGIGLWNERQGELSDLKTKSYHYELLVPFMEID